MVKLHHCIPIKIFVKKLRLYIAQFVTFIVALQVINMGLFAQDFQFNISPTSISYDNVINSMVEYVSEIVLNHINAMPENNNASNKDMQAGKHFAFKMVELKTQTLLVHVPVTKEKVNYPLSVSSHIQFCKEITPPPPKA